MSDKVDSKDKYLSFELTAQGIPHETAPITVLPVAIGPPESPMQVPRPAPMNVQMVLSSKRRPRSE